MLNTITERLVAMGYDAEVQEVEKLNCTKKGIIVKEDNIGTIFYEDVLEDMAKKSANLDALIDSIVTTLDTQQDKNRYQAENIKSLIPDKCRLGICRKDWNMKKLEHAIYRQVEGTDLYWYIKIIDDSCDTTYSVIVVEELLEDMNITSDELFNIAYAQTESECCIENMADILSKDFGMPAEYIEGTMPYKMYVVSNTRRMDGAAGAVMDETLRRVADIMHANNGLLVLPSSIHEVICVNVNDIDIDNGISDIIQSINHDIVDDTEVLSDHPYLWKNGELTILS